jgi:fumarate hydratase subunit beta
MRLDTKKLRWGESNMKKYNLPLSTSDIQSLHAGDYVLLSGKIHTARDAAHKLLVKSLESNEVLPFDLSETTIYYVGATPPKPGQVIGACGPTSSYRMDPFVEPLMNSGLKVMIGKGERSDEAKAAILRHNGLYLIVTGGIGALVSQRVHSSKIVLYPELGTEAIHELEVVDFPAIVAYDIFGNDLYTQQ